jgi:hypothetical protein
VTVYGVLWAYGFAASIRRNPHIVGPQQLRLRFGMLTDVGLSTRLIASARADRRGSHKRIVNVDDDTLSLATMGTTNVLAELEEPYAVDLGRHGVHTVRRLRFQADDPSAAVRTLRAAIAQARDAA